MARIPDGVIERLKTTVSVQRLAEKRLAAKSVLIAAAALRFLYAITLKKGWNVELIIPLPKKPQTLPEVLSPEEVRHFLSCVRQRKTRTVLTVCYAAGLRISEAVALKPADIDSQRMTLRVAQGKGQKDRYVMLSEQLLTILRDWYRFARPKAWLFHGAIPGRHITRSTVEQGCTLGAQRSGLSKPVTPHSLRHSCATHMLRAGAPIRHLQEMLGHASIETTQIYTRVTITDLKAVHRRFHPREQRRDDENGTKDDQSNPSCTENPLPDAQSGSRRRA
jgi:integrase/recombinase XerD